MCTSNVCITPSTGQRNLLTFSLDESETGLMTTSPMTTQFVPLASDEEAAMFNLVNFAILCGLLSPFGVITNVINIVVFVKLGFHDSMNISLLGEIIFFLIFDPIILLDRRGAVLQRTSSGLAVSDLVSLVSMVFVSLCFNPLFVNAGLPFDPMSVQYMVGGGVHVCFARITSLITAFITFERCLCIAMPLKVKLIITPTRTKLIIFSIFVVMFVVFSPFYFVNKLTWEFDADRNATILTHTYTDDRIIVETVTFLIHGVIFSVFCFVLVIFCTAILVVKLNSKTKWREASAAKGANAPEGVGVKEKRVAKMVIFISSIFIGCFFPATAILLALALVPELALGGKYENMWFIVWSVSCVMEIVNSSVNIFVYLQMSSKFRSVFMKTFLNREEK